MIGQGENSRSLADIAAQLGGDVLGDGQTLITQVATLASAGKSDIAFLANRPRLYWLLMLPMGLRGRVLLRRIRMHTMPGWLLY